MIIIPDAAVVRQQTPTEGFDRAVAAVVRDIQEASAKGLRNCPFNPWYMDEDGVHRFDEEAKELFLSKGYSFRPTGYIGGVWQRTERICW